MSNLSNQEVELIAPFIDGMREIFKTMLMIELKCEPPMVLSQDQARQSEFTSTIGMNGTYSGKAFKGLLIVSFDKTTFLKVASAMLGEDYSEINDENKDVGNEMANMVCGQAKAKLVNLGLQIEMALPVFLTGVNLEFNYPKETKVLHAGFKGEVGSFHLDFCYGIGN